MIYVFGKTPFIKRETFFRVAIKIISGFCFDVRVATALFSVEARATFIRITEECRKSCWNIFEDSIHLIFHQVNFPSLRLS